MSIGFGVSALLNRGAPRDGKRPSTGVYPARISCARDDTERKILLVVEALLQTSSAETALAPQYELLGFRLVVSRLGFQVCIIVIKDPGFVPSTFAVWEHAKP